MESLFINIQAKLTPEEWKAIRSPDVSGREFLEIWNEILKEGPNLPPTITSKELKFVLEETSEILVGIVKYTGISGDANLHNYIQTSLFRARTARP